MNGREPGAIWKAFSGYFISYGEAWGRYGILFSVLICGSLLLQAQDFLQNGGTSPFVYATIVLSFLITSTAVSVFKLDKTALAYNPADQVAWYLGTKKAPPWYLPVAKAILFVWVISFLGVIYLDSLVSFSRLARWEPTLPAIVLNLTLITQFLVPAFMQTERGAGGSKA